MLCNSHTKHEVDNGKQLIMFKHKGNDCSGENGCTKRGCTPKILEFYDYAAGTKHTFESIDEIENLSNSCTIERGENGIKAFYSVNNFVTG